MTTAWNRTEPPFNWGLGFEAAPTSLFQFQTISWFLNYFPYKSARSKVDTIANGWEGAKGRALQRGLSPGVGATKVYNAYTWVTRGFQNIP